MKAKYLFLLTTAIFSSSAFAVTDQLSQAQKFLTQSGTTLPTDEAKALAPKTEIRAGQTYPVLKKYQEQYNIPATGKLDEATLALVRQKQEELGYNVTKTLDYNTWFATYAQPMAWQQKVVAQSQAEWNAIIQKQLALEEVPEETEVTQAVTIANEKAADTEVLAEPEARHIKENISLEKFVVVNIPSMTVTGYEWDGENAVEVFNSRAVVGKINTKTPLDDMFIWGIKYHPTWTPTPNMLKRNVYVNGKVNTGWLRSHNIKAINSQGKEVSYSEIGPGSNVRLVQPAGNSNALGILKFETTSKENIYLHDTNEKRLFGHNTRAYSSGCVRVDDYVGLAQWVAELDKPTFDKKMSNKGTRIEKTPQKVPVYYTYSQVSFKNGTPTFYPDVYKNNSADIVYE